MAGLFAHFGPASPDRLTSAALRLQVVDEQQVSVSQEGFSFVWTGVNDVKLFGPALDPGTGVRVVTAGRVSWDESGWRHAECLPFEGGLSNRLLLEAYLAGGVRGVERHNGPALLLVWDPRTREVHLFTDHFGYHPVFVYHPEVWERPVVCTSADVLADDAAVSATPDPISMAELLWFWRTVPPHTYYREIRHAGAATHWTWNIGSGVVRRREYWEPFENDPFPSLHEAAEELAGVLREAVRIRTLPRLGPTACFLSGGMDSRAILFASADPSRTTGVHLYDLPNQEAAIAHQICKGAGVEFLGLQRDEEYYARWLPESVYRSGAMWSAEDAHFTGTTRFMETLGARTVTTACTADWLFKAYGMEATWKTLRGRNLPLKKLLSEREDAFLPNRPSGSLVPEIRSEVDRRFSEWFEGTPRKFTRDRDWLLVEDRRVRPVCYAPSVSGQIMYRTFPYDTFLADRAVADCYGRMRAEWKLNARVWGLAVARICGVHRDIPIASYGWRLDDSARRKMWVFAKGWLRRRLDRSPTVVRPDSPATDGSWPDLGWYVRHSPVLRETWQATPPEDREQMTLLWGSDPWSSTTMDEWSRRPNDFFRLATLLTHWRHRRREGMEMVDDRKWVPALVARPGEA